MRAGPMASSSALLSSSPQKKKKQHTSPHQPLPARMLKMLLLMLLVAASLMPALAKSHHSKAWDTQLPDTEMPKSLHVFRMNFIALLRFYHYIKKGTLASHSKRFCKSAHLACDPKLWVPSLQSDPDEPHHVQWYSQKSQLSVGQQITIPGLGSDYPSRAFLPGLLAKKLPFDSESLPELCEMLNIPEESRLASYMNETLNHCEKQKPEGVEYMMETMNDLETQEPEGADYMNATLNGFGTQKPGAAMPVRRCVRTVEKMVSLIVHRLGHHVEVLQTKWSSEANKKPMTIVETAFKGSLKSNRSIVCSEEKFPFSVYNCHEVEGVQNIEVTLESEDGKHKASAVVQCYSEDRKGFRVSADMKLVPALEGQRCLWLSEKDIVFVKKDEAEKKKKKKKKHDFWRVLLP